MANPFDLEFYDVGPSDVRFIRSLRLSKSLAIFHVTARDQECVMKVYRERPRSDCDPPDRDISLFVRESTAYRRLKAKGFCKRGIIPDFYGTIQNINPASWPWLDLDTFGGHANDLFPNAVLIEYIPGMQEVDLSNFSEMRIAKLRRILDSMHRAKVWHGDPYPRNMMVQVGDRETVLWIDFDRAKTLPEDTALTRKQEELLAWEDYNDGKLSLAYSYYYE